MQRKSITQSKTENLPYLNLCDSLDLSDLRTLVEREEEKMRRDTILRNHPSPITQLPNGDWYTRIGGKKVQSKNRKYVEDQIVYAASKPVLCINSIYEDYLQIRKENVETTTWRKDVYIFNTFLRTSCIGDKPLEQISVKDGYDFFNYCKQQKPQLKKRYWNNVRCTYNSIFQYCIDQGYLASNPFINLKLKRNSFAPPKFTPDHDKIFSDDERKTILSLAFNSANKAKNAIVLGIVLLFNLGVRIGELSALKWKDIETDNRQRPYIHIQGQIVEKDDKKTGKRDGWKYIEYTKTEAGNRRLPLNTTCQKSLEIVKDLNNKAGFGITPDDFIFQRIYKKEICFCSPRSFTNQLEHLCIAANMSVIKSPHDARRTVFTNLYLKGMPIPHIQKFAGHTTPAMTMEYIKVLDNNLSDLDFIETLGN